MKKSDYFFCASHVTVRYKDTYALQDLTITVYPGDFIALMGENGAGKSTFINVLNGIIAPTSGFIDYNPKFLNSRNPYSSIGFSSQRSIIDFYLNVEQNVRLGCAFAGFQNEELSLLTRKAIKQVHLDEKKNANSDELSGGQQQRIQIARAIAHRPQLYILDEPTTGLDAEISEQFFQFLSQEHEQGKTILICSHDLYLLEKYCTKLLFLDKGRVQYWGNMKDFISHYTPLMQYQLSVRRKTDTPHLQKSRILSESWTTFQGTLIIELIPSVKLAEAFEEITSQYDVLHLMPMSESTLRQFFVKHHEGGQSDAAH